MDNCISIKNANFSGMSAICACLIVCLHGGIDGWGLVQIAVPWFFFSSGYFLAKHIGEPEWWRQETIKRLRSLVIPFYSWLLIETIFVIVINYGAHLCGIQLNGVFSKSGYFGQGLLKLFGLNFFVCMGPLWYVRMLILLVFISPVLAYGNKLTRAIEVVVFFIGYLLLSCIWKPIDKAWWNFFEYGISVRGIAYFSAGMFFRQYPIGYKRGRLIIASIIVWSGFVITRIIPNWHETILILMIPAVVQLIYPFSSWASRWSSYSFPIYVMHVMLLMTITCGLGLWGIRDQSMYFWLKIVRVGLAIGIAILGTIGLRKACPRLSNFLFGWR